MAVSVAVCLGGGQWGVEVGVGPVIPAGGSGAAAAEGLDEDGEADCGKPMASARLTVRTTCS